MLCILYLVTGLRKEDRLSSHVLLQQKVHTILSTKQVEHLCKLNLINYAYVCISGIALAQPASLYRFLNRGAYEVNFHALFFILNKYYY
jgi:hypothetical protein